MIENDVHTYSWGIPPDLASKYPILKSVISEKNVLFPPYYRIAKIHSVFGKTFTSFAKYKKFNEGRNIVIL